LTHPAAAKTGQKPSSKKKYSAAKTSHRKEERTRGLNQISKQPLRKGDKKDVDDQPSAPLNEIPEDRGIVQKLPRQIFGKEIELRKNA